MLFFSIHFKPFCSRRCCRLPLSLYSWHCVCPAYYCALLHYAVCCTLCCPAVLRCTSLRCTYHASLCLFLLRCFFGFFASLLRYILVVLFTVHYLMLCCIFCRIECAMLRCILAFAVLSPLLCCAELCCVLCYALPHCVSLCSSVLRYAWLRFAVLRCASLLMLCLPPACCIMHVCF